uniref:Uncharacterized protein n=1 Tax=Anguilla anguilla TaxID=7936 RepID=A0A0E9WPX6_ANGAN
MYLQKWEAYLWGLLQEIFCVQCTGIKNILKHTLKSIFGHNEDIYPASIPILLQDLVSSFAGWLVGVL